MRILIISMYPLCFVHLFAREKRYGVSGVSRMNKSLSGTVSIFSLSPHQRLGISFIPFELIKLTDNKPSERKYIYIYLLCSTLLIGIGGIISLVDDPIIETKSFVGKKFYKSVANE